MFFDRISVVIRQLCCTSKPLNTRFRITRNLNVKHCGVTFHYFDSFHLVLEVGFRQDFHCQTRHTRGRPKTISGYTFVLSSIITPGLLKRQTNRFSITFYFHPSAFLYFHSIFKPFKRRLRFCFHRALKL